mmetsp:Transcript_25885/g.85182  ORF Transcript_25885/g.85182 Transcript_25885/m.85182 type:complete len:220 (+) Transcript_25885:57-716(+)
MMLRKGALVAREAELVGGAAGAAVVVLPWCNVEHELAKLGVVEQTAPIGVVPRPKAAEGGVVHEKVVALEPRPKLGGCEPSVAVPVNGAEALAHVLARARMLAELILDHSLKVFDVEGVLRLRERRRHRPLLHVRKGVPTAVGMVRVKVELERVVVDRACFVGVVCREDVCKILLRWINVQMLKGGAEVSVGDATRAAAVEEPKDVAHRLPPRSHGIEQ